MIPLTNLKELYLEQKGLLRIIGKLSFKTLYKLLL